MGSSADLYIRCHSAPELAQIRDHYPNASLDAGSHFAQASVSRGVRFAPADVRAIADRLRREVIYLCFSSVTDSLQFTRCSPGTLHRHLQHGMYVEQGLWEEVDGTPEPWEPEAFFPAQMTQGLESKEDREMKRRMEELYERRFVVQGESDHIIDGRESARAAAHFYGLSGWS
jgi:hypothetical protein